MTDLATDPMELQRQATADASARLRAGEAPANVPCPRCKQERYLKRGTLGPYETVECDCCAYSWFLP